MTPLFGVIGNPIEHSISPLIHQQFALQTGIALNYIKILGEEETFIKQLRLFFQQGQGLNVTLPFKEIAFHVAVTHTVRCRAAKAANCLWLTDGQLHADNTDGIGFIRDIQQHLDLGEKKILILGAGGAARGLIFPLLQKAPKAIAVYNRSTERLNRLAQDFPEIIPLNSNDTFHPDLIINATSSQFKNESLLMAEQWWTTEPFCYDLSYTVAGNTHFTFLAQQRGCLAVDGLGMLIEQAAEAFFIWHGVTPNTHNLAQHIRLQLQAHGDNLSAQKT